MGPISNIQLTHKTHQTLLKFHAKDCISTLNEKKIHFIMDGSLRRVRWMVVQMHKKNSPNPIIV